jgi:rare lipoprotein A
MRLIFLGIILVILSSCGGKSCKNRYDHNYTGHFKIGKPYVIKDTVYHPKEDANYKEIGVASWYGDAFHCKKTSNNEVFDKKQLSAAHRTLPLPSIVKVTNLANGKAVNVIVNDRGPFAHNRIIDLSEKAAEKIHMKHSGVATVKVEYLAHESHALRKKLKLKTPKLPLIIKNPEVILINEQTTVKKIETNNLKQQAHSYYLSIGKYTNKAEAKSVFSALEQKYPVRLVHFSAQGKLFYEVELKKKFTNIVEAQQILEKVKTVGFKKAKILKV